MTRVYSEQRGCTLVVAMGILARYVVLMIGKRHPVIPGTNETPLSLLQRLRTSPDDSSSQRLADIYSPLVQRWLHQHGLPRSDADDLAQEVMLVIVREMPRLEHSGRKARALGTGCE